MAPVGNADKADSSAADGSNTDEEQDLWANILGEVKSGSASKLSNSRSLLVLGDNKCGKTTLIGKLQGVKDLQRGAGLEYYYIDVHDEYHDEQARLNVWVLDGDENHTGLLKYALTEENFEDTMVLLVVSMAQPWDLPHSLHKWVTVLSEHIDKLHISPQQMAEYQQSLVRFAQDYTDPGEGQGSSQAPPRGYSNPLHPPASATDEDRVVLPLGEGVLTQNLGIPVVVVVTKCDAISSLEKDHEFKDEHFDFIQQYVRKFCLKLGAGLFYTSVKDEHNCQLLYRYLVHRIYSFPFITPAAVVDRDSIFVPSGWDREKKISILYENLISMKPDDRLENIIVKPVTRKPVHRDAEVVTEEEQMFLTKLQTVLAKQAAGATGAAPPGAGDSTGPRPSRPNTQRTPERGAGAQASPLRGKVPPDQDGRAGQATAQATEGMLANFFNSLLHKKTGTASPEQAAVTRDAAAELERLRGKKSAGDTNTSNTPTTTNNITTSTTGGNNTGASGS